jgi:putative transposase
VKTTGVEVAQRGYDGGKKVKGRKRHLLVDTELLVLKAKVHSAKVLDQEGIERLLDGTKEMFPVYKVRSRLVPSRRGGHPRPCS